jgi:hypothetical protein
MPFITSTQVKKELDVGTVAKVAAIAVVQDLTIKRLNDAEDQLIAAQERAIAAEKRLLATEESLAALESRPIVPEARIAALEARPIMPEDRLAALESRPVETRVEVRVEPPKPVGFIERMRWLFFGTTILEEPQCQTTKISPR